jgi:hypothetical protein
LAIDIERHVPRRNSRRDADGFAHDTPNRIETILTARAAIDFPLDVWEHLDQNVGSLERPIDLRTEGGTERRSRLVARDIHELLPVLLQQVSETLH